MNKLSTATGSVADISDPKPKLATNEKLFQNYHLKVITDLVIPMLVIKKKSTVVMREAIMVPKIANISMLPKCLKKIVCNIMMKLITFSILIALVNY